MQVSGVLKINALILSASFVRPLGTWQASGVSKPCGGKVRSCGGLTFSAHRRPSVAHHVDEADDIDNAPGR
jgi:hypothetical protein